MGLPNPPMDEFGPRVPLYEFLPPPPMCRNCLIELDDDGYCGSCGVLNAAAVVQPSEDINGGRGESF